MIESLKTRVYCRNYEDSIAFFQLLGLRIIEQWGEEQSTDRGTIMAPAEAGNGLLELAPGAGSSTEVSLQFKMPDVSSLYDILPPALVESGPTLKPWGARYVYLKEPSGIPVIIYSVP